MTTPFDCFTRIRSRWATPPVAFIALAIGAAIGTARLQAHVGSPDVFFEGRAGAYRLLVAIRMPIVVPGVANVEVRVLEGEARKVEVVPLRLTGPGAVFAPVADVAHRSPDDARTYTAGLWMMVAGSWQVRVTVDGDRGQGQVAVPVDALPSRTLGMSRTLVLMLMPPALFIVLGFIAIVGASVGEAQADPGQETPPARRRRAWSARGVAAVLVVAIVGLGNWWWNVEARDYSDYVYKPLDVRPSLAQDGELTLTLSDPGWLQTRVLDDFVTDHGHLMHLFLVRVPNLDRLLHVHPRQTEPAHFTQRLPGIDAGAYRLFGDVVHATGLGETVVADVTLPAGLAGPPQGDDSTAVGASPSFAPDLSTSALAAGTEMIWMRDSTPFVAGRPYLLTFSVQTPNGTPVTDLDLYMGMPGHAIVVKRDLRVFAHVHPAGTAPMASIALASATLTDADKRATDSHAAHVDSMFPDPAKAATVAFPYGFPQMGDYRVFVQVKRRGVVLTGIFDVRIESPPSRS